MRLGCLLLVLSLPLRPDPALTPGAVRPLTTAQVCSIHWRLDERHVSHAMKRHVLEAYRLTWADHTRVVIDHLIARAIGGADAVRNLWPQEKAQAKLKDRLEVQLHKQVCQGTLSLAAAQAQMRAWGQH